MEKLREKWEQAYAEFWNGFTKCFTCGKTFVRAQEYVRRLMAGIERKNGWQLAEFIRKFLCGLRPQPSGRLVRTPS